MRAKKVKKSRFVALGNDEWQKRTYIEWTNHNRPELGRIYKEKDGTFSLWCNDDIYCLNIPTLEEAIELSQEVRWIRYNYVIRARRLCESVHKKHSEGGKK